MIQLLLYCTILKLTVMARDRLHAYPNAIVNRELNEDFIVHETGKKIFFSVPTCFWHV
uniref:Uncharacterized protein n=1 Tax=Arundo donax TaxID=35708 RepID=A0A0A9D8I0_ARUDO